MTGKRGTREKNMDRMSQDKHGTRAKSARKVFSAEVSFFLATNLNGSKNLAALLLVGSPPPSTKRSD